jgi:predicted GNAT family N-acyltransferase
MEVLTYQPAFKEQCVAIFESNQPMYFAPEEKPLFIRWLDHHTASDYFVVKDNDTVVACGGIFFDSRTQEAGLSWGMVHARFHKQGIGRYFTQYRIGRIRSAYPDAAIRIETSQHTRAFYEKMGFSTVDIVPDGFGAGLDKYNMRSEPQSKP